ncbi:hypothetical protein QM953_04490 [Streptococcus cristatus]|uniref:hypothetical protein n=1 Tax=Streptococcus cristatus TaxID=45634 RepID=UPI0039C2C79D
MVYIAKLDFDDFYDLGDGWKTSFKLPNGANFEFWNCNLRYIDANEFHYLEIIANERKNIEECLLILSFCTTIPLIALNYEIINTAYSGNINNRQQDKMIEWIRRLADIEQILRSRRNRSDDRRREYFDLMKKCILGARNGYREYSEDEFMMYFKTIEKISKLYLSKYNIVRGQADSEMKNIFQTFLKEEILYDTLHLEFDSATLENITGEVYNLFKNKIIGDNHRRIVVVWEKLVDSISVIDPNQRIQLLNQIDSTRIHELVKVRNGIAHGEIVELSLEIKADVEYLAYQMISIYYFGKEYSSIHLSSKKFNRDFWG